VHDACSRRDCVDAGILDCLSPHYRLQAFRQFASCFSLQTQGTLGGVRASEPFMQLCELVRNFAGRLRPLGQVLLRHIINRWRLHVPVLSCHFHQHFLNMHRE